MPPRHWFLLAGLLATTGIAQDTRLRIEFPGFFSGRNDPLVVVADSARTQAILDLLVARWNTESSCRAMEIQALSYNGVRLWIDDAALGKSTVEVREGCVSPGHVDPGRGLERSAVAAAFFEDDLNAPGGPKPMTDLACRIPDALRPTSVPCATTSTRAPARSNLNSMPTAVVPATPSVGADGRPSEESRRTGLSATYPVTTP